MQTNRETRRERTPAKAGPVARHRKGFPSVKRATRKAERLLAGRRSIDDGLVPGLDQAFAIHSPPLLLLFGVGRDEFNPHERARRRARNKRQRVARKANR